MSYNSKKYVKFAKLFTIAREGWKGTFLQDLTKFDLPFAMAEIHLLAQH